jgi:hypothetical protein
MRIDLAGPSVAFALLASVAAALVLATASSWSGQPQWIGSGFSSFAMHGSNEGAGAQCHCESGAVDQSAPDANEDGYVEDLTKIIGNDPPITGAIPRQ